MLEWLVLGGILKGCGAVDGYVHGGSSSFDGFVNSCGYGGIGSVDRFGEALRPCWDQFFWSVVIDTLGWGFDSSSLQVYEA